MAGLLTLEEYMSVEVPYKRRCVWRFHRRCTTHERRYYSRVFLPTPSGT